MVHRGDVEIERERPPIFAAIEDRSAVHHAGTVEQHVDRADRFRRRRDGGRIGDVQRQRADPGRALQALEVDVAGDHLGAGGGEQPGRWQNRSLARRR